MVQYILEFSKYFIALFIALYTYECFAVFRFDSEKKRNGIYIRQNILMFLIHLACYISILLKGGKIEYIFFFVFQQIALFTTIVLFHLLYPEANRLLINNMCFLLSIGFVILTRLSYSKAVKQFIIVAVSLVVSLAVPVLVQRLKNLKVLTWAYGLVGVLSLGVVLIAGAVTNGSKLSFTVAGLSFQPSEFVKILFVLCMAGFLYQAESFLQLVFSALIAGVHVIILVLSRDLGSALIFFIAYVVMVYCATHKIRYLFLGLASGSIASVIAYYLFSHVQVRVQAWKDPWSVIDGAGYQITQSLFAIGCGQWFGLGISQGSPKSIPYVETDFVFAAIAEELGVIFAICLILIYISCFLMFLYTARRLKDSFWKTVSIGLGVTYIFQIFLTVGGGIKFIPLTGVTLPLISYGGSSVLSTLLMFSIAEGISGLPEAGKRRKDKSVNVTAGVFVALFLAMVGSLVYFTATNEEELINNSYNPRQQLLLAQNSRGTIYARGGEVLAWTAAAAGDAGKKEDAAGAGGTMGVIGLEEASMRIYPYKELFAHTVGYTGKGKTGIEAQENYYLINSGIPFSQKAANEAAGVKNPGDNVYTTLDVKLQQKASEALGAFRGAVIAMDPETGEILAMVSKPSFDPNNIAGIWEELVADEESGILVNRASQGLYPPGSTFKMVTALEFIRENPDTYQNYTYQCTGSYKSGDETIRCYHGTVHGKVNLETAFAKSCNSAFADIGERLDKERFADTLEQFLFRQELPAAFTYNRSSAVVTEETTAADMLQISIGQGKTSVTPLHIAMLTSAAANGGVLMKPFLVDRVETAEGVLVKKYPAQEYGRLMSAEEAAALTGLMKAVVQSGTGTKLKGLSYTAAGKTGSAEFNGVKEDSHAWFTGFAPADNPKIVVTVIIEGVGSGGDYAVPIAKRVFDAYFE